MGVSSGDRQETQVIRARWVRGNGCGRKQPTFAGSEGSTRKWMYLSTYNQHKLVAGSLHTMIKTNENTPVLLK